LVELNARVGVQGQSRRSALAETDDPLPPQHALA
jgi:hypothetical protein